MKRNRWYGFLMLMTWAWLLLLLSGCNEDGLNPASPDASVLPGNENARYKLAENFDISPKSVTLFAGQTIEAGAIAVAVLEESSGTYQLRVTYTTTNSWELTEAQLWVGTTLSEMPQTPTGNPKIGNFPYKSGDITGAASYTFYVPLQLSATVCETTPDYVIAAHAALRKANGDGSYQTETGWGDGEPVSDTGSWATYFTVDLTCLSPTPTPTHGSGSSGGSETAFAFGDGLATCFLSIDEDHDGASDFQRWGWTNGLLAQGNYAFAIYAGAGQCDLANGVRVGTLQVNYDGKTAVVAYQMVTDASGRKYTLAETHLYLGNERLARDKKGKFTVAPGQYPFIHEGLNGAVSDRYTIENLSGSLYLVAHAVINMP